MPPAHSTATQQGPDGKWRGVCSCGSVSPSFASEGEALTWCSNHMRGR